jgi:hypothetical protein
LCTGAARLLGLGVRRCRHWLAVGHAGTFQKICSICSLRECEAGACAANVDAEEIADRAHVLERKRRLEVGDDLVEQRRGGGGEDDIIHVQQQIRHEAPWP